MIDLEERLQTYASAVLAEVAPVTADEVRRGRRHPGGGLIRVLAVAAVVLAVLGVGAAVIVDDNEGETNVTTDPSSFPLTLDGHRDWNVAVLNGHIAASDEELTARYSDDFLTAVPPDKFRSSMKQLVAMAPWRVIAEVERRGEDVLAVQLASQEGEQVRLSLHRSPSERIDGATILVAVPCAEPVATDTELRPALRDALTWINELLNSTRSPNDDELRARFSPSFLSAIPPDRLRGGLPQARELGPYGLRSFEGPPTSSSLTARVGLRTGEEARLTLAVEPNPPHRITTFSVLTQQPCRITRSP